MNIKTLPFLKGKNLEVKIDNLNNNTKNVNKI